jgi:HEAT repeat protein
MRKLILTIIITIIGATASPTVLAGDISVPDVETVRLLLLQPDMDFTIFDGEELCSALIYLIENDGTDIRDKIVRRALCNLPETGDERAVEYLMEYIDDYPLDCLYGLGDFSTPESCNALLDYTDNDDESIRRFSAQSLGKLDYTVSDEMWELRDSALAELAAMLENETEEWIIPKIEKAYSNIASQVREDSTAS